MSDEDLLPDDHVETPNRWPELLEKIAVHQDKLERMAMEEWTKMVVQHGLMHEVAEFTFIFMKNDVSLYSAMNEAMFEWDM